MNNNQNIILLVEDNPGDEALTLLALKENNINNHIDIVHDGEEALDYLFAKNKYTHLKNINCPKLILLDLKLPKINGNEVLKQLRNNNRTAYIPVVMLISSKENNDIINSYDNGVNSYVRKPLSFKQYSNAIGQISLYWLMINHNSTDTTQQTH